MTEGSQKVAVALSGGGIRSATFSLGLLQALARRRLLGQVAVLSTVSGGGYIGGFLCRLAASLMEREQLDAAHAWRRTEDLLLQPGREPVEVGGTGSAGTAIFPPLQWLRENSRYLTPSGSGDLVKGAAYYLRSLLALHFDIAVLLLFLGIANAVLGLGDTVRMALVPDRSDPPSCGAVEVVDFCSLQWVASGAWVPAGVLLLVTLAAGVAYWLTYRPQQAVAGEGPSPLARAERWMPWFALAAMAAGFLLWAVLADDRRVQQRVAIAALGITLLAGIFATGAWLLGVEKPGDRTGTALAQFRVDVQRKRLTNLLSTLLLGTAALSALALVDSVAMALVQYHAHTRSYWPLTVPAAVYGTLLAAAWKWLDQAEPRDGQGSRFGGVLQVLLVLLAMLLAAGLALIYQVAAYELVLDKASREQMAGPWEMRSWAWLAMAAALALVAVCIQRTPAFLNLSSFHNLYAARLKRAYLGGANLERLAEVHAGHPGRRDAFVDELHPADEPAAAGNRQGTEAYYAANSALGIEHLVNLTLNERVSATSPTQALDRQGVPLVLRASGLQYGNGADGTDPGHFSFEELRRSPLTLGQWLAISGAAFSVGVGKETRMGYALLAFLANVRTAYWWRTPLPSAGQWRRYWEEGTWGNLWDEFRCNFRGRQAAYWYLSDGGHFDNTALYELVRDTKLGPRVVLASDNGADPHYLFDDLTHLLRILRIDLGVEAVIRSPGDAGSPVAGLEGFGTPGEFREARAKKLPMPFALWVEFYRKAPADTGRQPDLVVLVVKPALAPDIPADVAHYAQTHGTFPQETTSDQFFDEAQWESYRALGEVLGGRVLDQGMQAARQRLGLL